MGAIEVKNFSKNLDLLTNNFKDLPINKCVEEFTQFLKIILESQVNFKGKRMGHERSRRNIFQKNKWFDLECKSFKKLLNTLAINLKQDPHNQQLQNDYWTKKAI